jgi:hypothetical protein
MDGSSILVGTVHGENMVRRGEESVLKLKLKRYAKWQVQVEVDLSHLLY